MIKAICMDLDGTLLTSEKTISDKTITGLRKFADDGVHLILASGRSKSRIQDYAKMIGLQDYHGKIIESNGAAIYDYRDDSYEVIKRMSCSDAKRIAEFIRSKQKEVLIMGVEDVYILLPEGEDESTYLKNNEQMEGLKNREFYYINRIDEIPEAINKLCTLGAEEDIEEMYQELYEKGFDDNFWWGRAIPTWLEITPKEVSKGNALLKLMDTYSWKSDEVIAFGDGENDLSMLKVVEHSVAMANAMDIVKDQCQFVCNTNDENGIIKFLELKEEIL